VRDDVHSERSGARGDFLADPAEAHQPQRLAAELDSRELLLVPHATLHRGVRRGHRAGQRQHQRQRVFGDAHAVGARGVHHHDAACAGSGDVHVVDAGTGAGNHPKVGSGGNQRLVDGGGAAHHERVSTGEVACQIRSRAAGLRVDRTPGQTLEQSDRGGRQLIGNDDVHGVGELVQWMLRPVAPDMFGSVCSGP
jgi:hypothetical protein